MDELLKRDVALALRAEVSDKLVDALRLGFVSQVSKGLSDFWMEEEIP